MFQKSVQMLLKRNVSTVLQLTKIEQDVCGLLKDYVAHYNATATKSSEPLTLRITGGWVRDKLLGHLSHDLDIAVNNMTGEQFATGLNTYLTEHYSKYGIKPHSIHKIDKNPAKSKHLETATTKLFGVEVDFVNLRSEEYTTESRIPIVACGTPAQDAMRRDATLNALFYNIQQEQIEDYTGRGLKDLDDGVLRTPLPPKQTFLDDPLRVLRLIRFASRFNFSIDEETYEAMKDQEINQAFEVKISRERVGVELQKILTGPNPLRGLHLIQGASLENVIFYWHNDLAVIDYNNKHTDMSDVELVYKQLSSHIDVVLHNIPKLLQALPHLKEKYDSDAVFKQNFILGVTLAPFSTLSIISNPKKMHNRLSVTESIIKEGLKFGKNDAEIVAKCVDTKDQFQETVKNIDHVKRSQVGTLLRSYYGDWQLAHYINLSLEYFYDSNVLGRYEKFYTYVVKQDLENCHTLKPLVDGKKLSKLLQMKPGPWMGKVNSQLLLWQLDNPGKGEKELLEFVKRILPDIM